MKMRPPFLIIFLASVLLKLPLSAQESYCTNIAFELANFTSWVGYTWQYSRQYKISTPKIEEFNTRRHAIMSNPEAYDANTGYALKIVPPGYKFSARLGDATVKGDPRPRCWQQSLRYKMTIDSSNAILVVKFALVLEYLSTHLPEAEPRFRLTLYDQKGDPIPDANYDVYASSSSFDGFKQYTLINSSTQVHWRDWTTVIFNLLKYYGQSITLEFLTADCSEAYHFGYAYVVAECHPLKIKVKYCADDSNASLIAPEGFSSYQWTSSSGIEMGNSQTLELSKTVEGDTYTCTMESATGDKVTLRSTVYKYMPHASFGYTTNCDSNIVRFNNLSTIKRGALNYKWDFGDGVISTQLHPKHTFSTSGMHPVELIVYNPPSACIDTSRQMVESFSKSLVGVAGDSTYCPEGSVLLKAYGAYKYTWSNSSQDSSLKVSSPGGTVWAVGKNSTGDCTSDTIYKKITEEPDWDIYPSGDTVFCTGSSTVLKAKGAESYRWSNGKTGESVLVTQSGKYTVIGVNHRGCEKAHEFNVLESLLPGAAYTFTPSALNARENQITCSIPAQDGVQYTWDMGDGTIGSGTVFQHSYDINYEIKQFVITLKAINRYNCVDSTYQIVDIFPFIPNVFSPNGDGINDVFMPGMETQVFDRNGLLLYYGDKGWDGRYNGKLLGPDTYFYLIRCPDKHNELQTKKGYITLVR